MTREEAIRVLGNLKLYHDDDNDILEACDTAIEALQENESLARSVNEASELLRKKRPHGEWIEKCTSFGGKCWAKCSVCNEFANGFGRDNGFGHDYSYPNFCPNCGADMREGDSDA